MTSLIQEKAAANYLVDNIVVRWILESVLWKRSYFES